MRRSLSVVCFATVGALGLLVMATGCGGAGSQADGSKALEGKSWRATAIVGLTEVQTADGQAATAKFSAGQVGGSGSVNSWGASYSTGSNKSIQISELMTTEMAGPQDLMDQEAAYYDALQKAGSYEVTETSLTLFDAEGSVLVTYEVVPPASLVGTEWESSGYHVGAPDDQVASSDDPIITATFGADGMLSGNASINQYSTEYTANADGTMTIDALIVTTKMAGPENVMAQESAYLAALPRTASYIIDGDGLTLLDAEGVVVAQFTAK